MRGFLIMALAAAFVAGCSAKKDMTPPVPEPISTTLPVISGGVPRGDVPRAVVYKTNGDYADHVFVNLASDGTILSYPAPSDVTASSSGLPVGSWLLDRRGGIGENSRFLKWTYSEYATLGGVPSKAEILAAIIPDAQVTAVRVLPVSASEAIADPNLVRALLAK